MQSDTNEQGLTRRSGEYSEQHLSTPSRFEILVVLINWKSYLQSYPILITVYRHLTTTSHFLLRDPFIL
jgi:hypothetical protein